MGCGWWWYLADVRGAGMSDRMNQSNYDEMRAFADDAICRFRSNYSESGNAVTRLAEMVMSLTDKHEQSIQERLQALAVEMREVSLLMLADNQSPRTKSKGLEMKGASAIITEWLQSMEAEQTIQDAFGSGEK
jgi:hypothetical protein